MPHTLADSLLNRLLDAFPPRRAYPPATLDREPMPPPVAHFLKHLLQQRVQHEAAHLEVPGAAWFDAAHPDVQQARQALAEVLVRHGQFPAQAWESSVRQAVEQVAAYLTRPTATLVAFVFEDSEQAVAAEGVEQRLSFFTGYSYLQEATRLYFEQKQLPEIDRAHFTRLLRHIDRKVTKDYDADAWLRLMAPLFDLARRAGWGGIPTPLLLTFFEDKDAEVFVERLQNRPSHETFDEDDLRRLLEGEAHPEPEPVAASAEPSPARGHNGMNERAAAPPESEEAVPLWKQFQQGRTQPPAAPQRPVPRTARPAEPVPPPPPPTAGDPMPRWMQFRLPPGRNSDAAAPAASPASSSLSLEEVEHDVLGSIGARNRSLFVRHLFNDSQAEYERVLRRLHTAPTWPDASKLIAQDVFRKNQVNIYSDPAVLFTDAVEAKFG